MQWYFMRKLRNGLCSLARSYKCPLNIKLSNLHPHTDFSSLYCIWLQLTLIFSDLFRVSICSGLEVLTIKKQEQTFPPGP